MEVEFTSASYRALLAGARAHGYRLLNFQSFRPPAADQPVLLLRHDLDHALAPAEAVAELEWEEQAPATYFVQTGCEFYNLLSREGRRLIRRLVALGHEIGLHYEAERYVGRQAAQRLASDVHLLQDLSGQPIVSAAQHIPVAGARAKLGPPIVNEAYEPRFITAPMSYISDSLMRWRQATPAELIASRTSFQFLTHPECWTIEGGAMDEVMHRLLAEEIDRVRERFMRTSRYYDQLLATRAERDRAFREQRGMVEAAAVTTAEPAAKPALRLVPSDRSSRTG